MIKAVKNKFKKVFAETNWVRIIVFIVLCVYAFTMIYTLVWAFFNSLKSPV